MRSPTESVSSRDNASRLVACSSTAPVGRTKLSQLEVVRPSGHHPVQASTLTARDSPPTASRHSALPDRGRQQRTPCRIHLVGHISRDSTAIEGREKPTPKPPQPAAPKRQRGRPRKGEQRPPKESRRLQRQPDLTLAKMVADLPAACNVGTKRNAKGHQVIMDRLPAAYRRPMAAFRSVVCSPRPHCTTVRSRFHWLP